MFESRVVAETVSELRGRYSPGSAPRVALDGAADSDSVFAHEDAHRTLIEGSTLGLYMMALACASSRSASESIRQLAAEELTEVCEQCWFVQEGFATFSQEGQIRGKHGDLAAFEAALLPSYRSARDKFNCVDRQTLERLIRLSWPEPKKDEERIADATLLAMHSAAMVLAGAAMCMPLASAFDASATLPNARITAQIRRNSPDLRLQRLVPHMDAEFAFECYVRMLSVMLPADQERLFQTMDECLDALMAELGEKAGVQTEGIRRDLQVPAMLEKLGVPADSFVYHDVQGLPVEQARSHFASVAFDAAEELVQNPPLPLEDARRGYAEQVLPQVAGPLHIVCELGPRGSDSQVTVFVHVYAKDRTDASGRLAGLIHTAAEPEKVGLLPTYFAAGSWSWLIGDFSLGEWDTYLLRRSGQVFAGRMHLGETEPRRHAQEFLIPANPSTVSFSKSGSEPALVLVVFEPRAEDGDCLLLDIVSSNWLQTEPTAIPPFEMNCAGNALKYGYLRGIVSVLMRGSHAG